MRFKVCLVTLGSERFDPVLYQPVLLRLFDAGRSEVALRVAVGMPQRRGFNIAGVVAVLDRSRGYLRAAVARLGFGWTNGRRSGDG